MIPFACLRMRMMLRDLVSQTLIMPSSAPETKRNPSAAKAKQVTALLFQKKKNFFKELLDYMIPENIYMVKTESNIY